MKTLRVEMFGSLAIAGACWVISLLTDRKTHRA